MIEYYVADSIALSMLLGDRLPSKAQEAFNKAEDGKAIIIVPNIALAELAYNIMKGRIDMKDSFATVQEVITNLRSANYIQVVEFTTDTWKEFFQLKIPELHDRMIAAVAVSLKAPVITKDAEIASQVPTIW